MSEVIRLHAGRQLPAAFPHGGGLLAAARDWGCDPAEILDLSTGLHPAGPPAWLAEWFSENAGLVGCYPDADGEPACGALADALGVPPANLRLTAGAQAAIEVIFHAMGWRSMAIRTPCYAEPIRCAQRISCHILPFAEGEAVPAADALWWTTPANPTGLAEPFPAGQSGVLDESYMPFAGRRQLGVMPGVMRIGSLTKTFAIPGLRIGYVVAETELLQRLDQWLPPWPAPTQALYLLPHLLAEAEARDAMVEAARKRLEALLLRCGWQLQPSAASFVLARPTDGRLPPFAAARILVRSFPEWPELAGWLRFGLPGSEAEWQRLEQLLCR